MRNRLPSIWLIEDEDECCDENGVPIPFYTFVHKGWEPDAKTVKAKDASRATLEQLVRLCDQDAENVNAHDYVGAHRLLGAVLFRSLGRKKATAIMREIAKRGGLHGMNGLCDIPDAYKALGVGVNGRDWDGSYD